LLSITAPVDRFPQNFVKKQCYYTSPQRHDSGCPRVTHNNKADTP